jgi:hypothetical protein
MPPPTNLEDTWERVRADIESRFRLYPAAPYSEMAMPEADWPEPTPAGFLDFASAVGADVVYAAAIRIDDPVSALAEELAGGGVELTEAPLAQLGAHVGEIRRVELAFSYGGVLHRWIVEAAWWREALATSRPRKGDV